MIIRVLTARVSRERSARVHVLLREQLPLIEAHDGLVYAKLARRLEGRDEEIILFEEWRDPPAMYAWTGPDPNKARFIAGVEELIDEVRVTHYEALDIDPE